MRTGYTNSYIEISFKTLSSRPPFHNEVKRLEFLERLNEIPDVKLDKNMINLYPSIPLSVLFESDSLTLFFSSIKWVLSEIDKN